MIWKTVSFASLKRINVPSERSENWAKTNEKQYENRSFTFWARCSFGHLCKCAFRIKLWNLMLSNITKQKVQSRPGPGKHRVDCPEICNFKSCRKLRMVSFPNRNSLRNGIKNFSTVCRRVLCDSRLTKNFEQLNSDNRHTRREVYLRNERWRRCGTAAASLEANGGRCQAHPHSKISCTNNKIWKLLLCRKDESEKSFALSSICWLFNKDLNVCRSDPI